MGLTLFLHAGAQQYVSRSSALSLDPETLQTLQVNLAALALSFRAIRILDSGSSVSLDYRSFIVMQLHIQEFEMPLPRP